MQAIYPPAYAHFWTDGGAWYLESQYDEEAFFKDLADPVAEYFFVLWRGEVSGILRLVHGRPVPEEGREPATKLHRLYLSQRVHGNGIGRRLVDWSEKRAGDQGSPWLWLEAMDTGPAGKIYERLGFTFCNRILLPFARMHPERRGLNRMKRVVRPNTPGWGGLER